MVGLKGSSTCDLANLVDTTEVPHNCRRDIILSLMHASLRHTARPDARRPMCVSVARRKKTYASLYSQGRPVTPHPAFLPCRDAATATVIQGVGRGNLGRSLANRAGHSAYPAGRVMLTQRRREVDGNSDVQRAHTGLARRGTSCARCRGSVMVEAVEQLYAAIAGYDYGNDGGSCVLSALTSSPHLDGKGGRTDSQTDGLAVRICASASPGHLRLTAVEICAPSGGRKSERRVSSH